MKQRFRLLHRGERGTFYCVDTQTKKRTSLGPDDEDAARRIVHARNEAERQPMINLQIARAHLMASYRSAKPRG
jgi:hypothetical protein